MTKDNNDQDTWMFPATFSPWQTSVPALEIQTLPWQSYKLPYAGIFRDSQIVKITRLSFKQQGFLKY